MSLENLALLVVSFGSLLFGANLIVKSVDRFSHKLGISSFAISFFILGLLTSIPELAVGLTAVAKGTPEVFVGNLIGGVAIIFFLVIPFLAIFGNGVHIHGQLTDGNLRYSLFAILAPSFILLDKKITNIEGVAMIVIYSILFFVIERKKGVFDESNTKILNVKSYSYYDIARILIGVLLVFVSSNIIVRNILLLANTLHVSSFFVSLLVVSIGTNLPEISLAVRSVVLRKKDIAFGDYIGSAAANTLLFGVFTLLNSGHVLTESAFLKTFIFLAAGLLLFYFFTRSKKTISKKEGFILIAYYFLFMFIEKM